MPRKIFLSQHIYNKYIDKMEALYSDASSIPQLVFYQNIHSKGMAAIGFLYRVSLSSIYDEIEVLRGCINSSQGIGVRKLRVMAECIYSF